MGYDRSGGPGTRIAPALRCLNGIKLGIVDYWEVSFQLFSTVISCRIVIKGVRFCCNSYDFCSSRNIAFQNIKLE